MEAQASSTDISFGMEAGASFGGFGASLGFSLAFSRSESSQEDQSMRREGKVSKISNSAIATLFTYTVTDVETLPFS